MKLTEAATHNVNVDLPEGWGDASVLDLADLIRGVSCAKGEARTAPYPGGVTLLRANNIGDGILFEDMQYVPSERVGDEQRLRLGDVVVAMSSGSKAVVGKAGEDDAGDFGQGVSRRTGPDRSRTSPPTKPRLRTRHRLAGTHPDRTEQPIGDQQSDPREHPCQGQTTDEAEERRLTGI